jgi:hypothetical protein
MEPYAQIPDAGPFAASADLFTILVKELQSAEAAGLTARAGGPAGRAGPGGAAAAAARSPGPAGGAGGAGRPPAPPVRHGRGRGHADPGGDRSSPAAGHAVRHGAGHPVRVAPPGSAEPVPGRCRPVAASLPAIPRCRPAGRAGSRARLVRDGTRGDHPQVRPGDRQAAGRAGGGERRRGYRRVLRCPCPGAVHRLDAAGDLRRCQGDRDAARGAAGRRPGACILPGIRQPRTG